MISKLRKDLSPEKIRSIVTRCGLPSCGSISKSDSTPDLHQISSLCESARVKRDAWLTMADIKVQAVKAVCYEIALSGFKQTRSEIEAVCFFKLQELCQFYGKRDPKPSETYRAVARDVMDTVGFCEDEYSSLITNKKDGQSEKVKSADVIRHVLEDLVTRVAEADFIEEDNSFKEPTNKPDPEIEKLKDSMSTLVNLFRGVKLDNASKEEEMKMMKTKMQAMERALNANAEYGKSLLLQNFVDGNYPKSSEPNLDQQSSTIKQGLVFSDANSVATSTTSEGEKGSQKSSETGYSPRYIHSNDFSQPSHGVVVPNWVKTKEEKIDWLMENDVAFRRGRLRWEAQQKRHQANLKSQELNKEKRRLEREKSKSSRVQPRFPFKSATKDVEREKSQTPKSTRKYFEGPRRKTCSALKESEMTTLQSSRATPPTDHHRKTSLNESLLETKASVSPKNELTPVSEASFIVPELNSNVVKRPHAVTIKTEDGKEVKWNREPYATQRRRTWCNFSRTNTDSSHLYSQPQLPVQQFVCPSVYRSNIRPCSTYQGQDWIDYAPQDRNWSQCLQGPVLFDVPYPSFVQPNMAYVGQSLPRLSEERFDILGYETQIMPTLQNQVFITGQVPRRPAPPVLLVDKPQFVFDPSFLNNSSLASPSSPKTCQTSPSEVHSITPIPKLSRKTESPPYMSTSMDDKEKVVTSASTPQKSIPQKTSLLQSPEDRSESKRKVVFKGVYLPPFRRKNLEHQTKL